MKIICLCFFSLFLATDLLCQNYSTSNPDYITNVKAGEEALKNGKYQSCLDYYKLAFEIKQTSYLSTLRAAACAYSLEKNEVLTQYLDTAFALNWDQSKEIVLNYEEFEYLKNSKFFELIETRWLSAMKASGLDMKLREAMTEIRRTDQLYRGAMRETSEKYGWESPQMDSLWTLQNTLDSINQELIVGIIDQQGYPGSSKVGPRLANTAFLVIQHAPQAIQEKYLPVLTREAEKGELRWGSLALLIDRVRLKQGKKQIYGSQIHGNAQEGHYFGPIEQPYEIDSLRNSVGLGPLQDYADHWNIKWDPDKHIERHEQGEK